MIFLIFLYDFIIIYISRMVTNYMHYDLQVMSYDPELAESDLMDYRHYYWQRKETITQQLNVYQWGLEGPSKLT